MTKQVVWSRGKPHHVESSSTTKNKSVAIHVEQLFFVVASNDLSIWGMVVALEIFNVKTQLAKAVAREGQTTYKIAENREREERPTRVGEVGELM